LELSNYYAKYAPLFARSEQREWGQLYMHGQLSDLERKSIEPMVLRERGKDINAVRAVQQFIGEGAWDDDRILERHQQLVAADLGEPGGTVIVDGSGFPKKGEHSVGVQQQYCGALSQTRQLPTRSLPGLCVESRSHFSRPPALHSPDVV